VKVGTYFLSVSNLIKFILKYLLSLESLPVEVLICKKFIASFEALTDTQLHCPHDLLCSVCI